MHKVKGKDTERKGKRVKEKKTLKPKRKYIDVCIKKKMY